MILSRRKGESATTLPYLFELSGERKRKAEVSSDMWVFEKHRTTIVTTRSSSFPLTLRDNVWKTEKGRERTNFLALSPGKKQSSLKRKTHTSFLPAKKGTTVVAHANRNSYKLYSTVLRFGESLHSKTTLNYSHIKRGKDNSYLHPCFLWCKSLVRNLLSLPV